MTGKEWLQKLAWWGSLLGVPFAARAALGVGWLPALGIGIATGIALAMAIGLLLDRLGARASS